MIKYFVRTALLAVAMTGAAASTLSAQETQNVTLTVASTNDFTVSGAPALTAPALTAGQDTSVVADSSTATYSVATNATGTTSGFITAHISTGAVPSGTKLLVKFLTTGDNAATEQELNGVTSGAPVTVLTGLQNETVPSTPIIYTFKVTAAAGAATSNVEVTYTFTPAV